MDCDCETGCYKCSNYPKEMDEHIEQPKCEGCNSYICECGIGETHLYSFNPNSKYGNMLIDSPPKKGFKRRIYLSQANRYPHYDQDLIFDDEVSVKYIPLSVWNRLRIKCQLKL